MPPPRYPSYLSDEEWAILEPLLSSAEKRGRPPKWPPRLWVATVVGMPALQDRPVTLVGEGRRRHSFISARDVAAFAVAAVDNPAARNAYLAIGGPEPLTWLNVVGAYERVLDRSVPVQFVGMGESVPGLPGPMPEMLAGMETYDTAIEMDEMASTFGVSLTSLEAFVREQAASQPG